jgi:hypothetical protein
MQGMTQGLSKRERLMLVFAADMKAVSYLHLAQYIAPNHEPATDPPPKEAGGESSEEIADADDQAEVLSSGKSKPKRGGNRRNAPWPRDRRLRLKAVSRIIKELERKGWVEIADPWKDRPKWMHVTILGLRRLGLDYNEAQFPENEEELDHLYQITRVRLLVGRRLEDPEAAWFPHTWISERAIKARYPQNEAGVTLPHLPDGALELDEDALVKMADGEKFPFKRGDCLAVEVERSRKNFARLDVILPNLLKHYAGVWYFCNPKAADAVHATIERLVKAGTLTRHQAKLIRVIDLEEEK